MYGIVTTVVVIGLIAALIGVFIKLPIFGKRRLVALAVLLVLGTGGIWLSDALRSPEQVQADEKMDAHLGAMDAAGYDDVERNPEDYISLDPTFTTDFGAGRMSGTLSNRSKFDIRNIRVRCDQKGETGKRLDRETLTITKSVPAEGSVEFGPLDIGYVDEQTVGFDCRPVDAEAIPTLRP